MIIISDCLTDKADEGTIKIASKLAKMLRQHNAKIFQLNDSFSLSDKQYTVGKIGISYELIKDLRKSKQCVLYIPNASMTLGICLKAFMIKIFSGCRLFLLPVYRRSVTPIMKLLLQLSKAELIVLSKESYDSYDKILKNKVHYVKAGVDTTKFIPVTAERKKELREKYGLKKDDKILLHVGHMVEARNLRKLLDVSDEYHVVVVVSTSTRWDENLFADLSKKNNISIVHEYIANIEEYYQLADAYLFLVENIGCVDVPLSVLEAASCNIPIVTTRYGELESLDESAGFIFIRNFTEINKCIEQILQVSEISNREMILEYDWKNSVSSIVSLFEGE